MPRSTTLADLNDRYERAVLAGKTAYAGYLLMRMQLMVRPAASFERAPQPITSASEREVTP